MEKTPVERSAAEDMVNKSFKFGSFKVKGSRLEVQWQGSGFILLLLRLFVSLNRYGRLNIVTKLFRIRFVKRSSTWLFILPNLDILNSNIKSWTAHNNHGGGPSGLLKYAIDIYTGMPQKNSWYDTGSLAILWNLAVMVLMHWTKYFELCEGKKYIKQKKKMSI